MRLVVLASGGFAIPTLRSIHGAADHQIAVVVTQPDRPAGRGRKPFPTPVKEWALEAGHPVIEAENVNDPMMVERLREFRAELGLVIAFGQKLGPALIEAFPAGCVNLHASLLPRYRGAAPIQWAILSGEEKTGVTVFRLTGRMDAGPILATRWTTIGPEETADELHERLARIGPDAVQAALDLFKGGAVPKGEPQTDEGASRAPKLSKGDGRVTFDQAALLVLKRIHGLWSWPGATCEFVSAGRRERVTLARARIPEVGGPPGAPGVLDGRLYVSAVDGWIELLEIQPQSGKLMSWPAFVNGRHVRAGDWFEPIADV